jgi:hypothetical protein
MIILRKFKVISFWLLLALIMLPLHAVLYGSQQLPDNIINTAITWINQVRTREGFEKLTIDPKLDRIAEAHSENMAEYDMLSESNPTLRTPFERMKASGLTDTNNIVAVAQAKTWELLRQQLESPENLSKILSPDMTRAGIGIKQDSTGDLWLTVHMTERAITFTQYNLVQSNTTPVRRSITIKGNTPYKKIEVTLVPPDSLNPDLFVDRIIDPDANGNFEITLTFGTATGIFDFEFYVQVNGEYKLTNFFSMSI